MESVQAPPPCHTPLPWVQCLDRGPARARSKHQEALFMPAPLPIPEQNAFPTCMCPTTTTTAPRPRPPSPAPLCVPTPLSSLPRVSSGSPAPSPFLSPFPRSLVLPFSLPSFQTPPHISCVSPSASSPFCSQERKPLVPPLVPLAPPPLPPQSPLRPPPGALSLWPGAPSGVCACSLLPTAKSSKGTF